MPLPFVLWYLPVGDTGGVLRHALDVAHSGMARHRLVFVVPSGPAAARLRATGARVIVAPVGVADGPVRSLRSLRQVVHSLRPAIVHSHLAYADVILGAARLPRNIARVTTEHGISGKADLYHSSALRRIVTPRLHALRMKRFAAAIAVSASTAEEMRRQWHTSIPLHVMYNGVDVQPRQHGSGRRLLTLSRFAPEKRVDRILEAFAALHSADPSWSLTVGGDGPLRESLLKLATDLKVADAVRFPGFIDSEQALKEHDVLVQLSEWENCSYSLLDAMAAGLGVVATDVGGNSELLPEASLTAGSEDDLVKRLKAQALVPAARPTLPMHWPTVSDMVANIEDVYEGLVR